jgi:hypothetical protein
MRILVPWKQLLSWGLLSGMILVGFVASSVLEGQDPFAPGASISQPTSTKAGVTHVGRQSNSSRQATRTSGR